MRNSLLFSADLGVRTKQASAKSQSCLLRIKPAFRIIANRKASYQRARELWHAGSMR